MTDIPQGYKDSPLGVIPKEWEVKRLGDIAKITSGTTPLRSNVDYFINGNIPWVKTTDLNNSTLIHTEEFVTEKALDETSLKILPIGTILVAMYGGYNQIGRTGLLKINATINQALAALFLDIKKADGLFVLNWLNSNVGWWKRYAASSRKDPNITSNDVAKFPILLPPLSEQQKIAEVLSTWDEAIEKQSQLVEKLELRKKGLMQQLLTGKKRLPGFSGGAWKKVKLGDIGQCYSGLTNKNKSDFECGAAKFITYMNVFCHGKIDINILGRVNIEADEKQEKVKKGDIFFTVSSETPEEVGMSSVLMDDVNNTYLNSFCFGFRLYNNEILLPKYAICAFRGTDMRKNMYRIAQGSTRFNLSKDEVMSLKITVPTVQEQNAIAEILSFCDKEIALAKQKLDTLRQQKKGLMQVLLTGKKRI